MKSNIKIISIALIAILIGIGIGYLLFGKNKVIEHHHPMVEGTTPTEAAPTTYTCSMHPQIRQEEFGICPICEMDLTPLGANTSDDPMVLQMTEEAVKLANIQTTICHFHRRASAEGAKNSGYLFA